MNKLLVHTAALALAAAASATTPRIARAQASFAGVWVLDSTSTGAAAATTPALPTPTQKPSGSRAPDSSATRTASNGALAPAAPATPAYRSVMTILQLDTAVVIDRRLEDAAHRAVAASERFSYRLDDVERTVPWTTPSGNAGTATVRGHRDGGNALVLSTTRRVGPDADHMRVTQVLERVELAPGGQLKVTRTEYDGRRERHRVYWFSRR